MNLLIKQVGTEPGSSGSPIFLDKTTKVIGIHKASSNDEIENYGDFIFPIINKLNNMSKPNENVSKKTNKQNELKIIINLHPSEKTYKHYLLPSVFGEEFIKNNNDKCKIIINGREDFELNQLSTQYKGEKLINFIVNNNIEILEIILKETMTITHMDNMFRFFCEIILIDFINWDTSNITSMKGMFSYCSFSGIIKGISNWNTLFLI